MNNCPSASPADATPPSSPPRQCVQALAGFIWMCRTAPAVPSSPLPSAPLGTASLLPPPPSTPRVNLSGGPVASRCRQLAPPPQVRRPYGDTAFGDSEAPARLDGASGPQDRQTRSRRTGFGLTVAARAGGCGRPRCSSAVYPHGWRGKAAGEGRTRAAEAGGSRRAPTPAQPLSSL